MPPGVEAGATLAVVERSAWRVTVVTTLLLVLLAAVGSAVVPPTEALAVTGLELAGAVTLRVSALAEAPEAMLPVRVQVTTPATGAGHVQPVPEPETQVVPVGTVKVTTLPVDGEGPLLVTVAVYARLAAALTLAGPVRAMLRSALAAVTVRVTGALLLPAVGSGVVVATVAVVGKEPVLAGAVTVICKFEVAD